jgi:Pentapeptide repeats (8 copies)
MSSQRISTEDLDQAIAQHARWLETTGRQGKRADLTCAVLNGKNLSRLDLRGAILRGAQLSWVNLSHTNLGEADLCGAVMNHAMLKDAFLIGANLSGANLRCADLTGAELTDAIMLHADMRGAVSNTEPVAEAAPAAAVAAQSARAAGYTDTMIDRLRQMISTCSDSLAASGRFSYQWLISNRQTTLVKSPVVKIV